MHLAKRVAGLDDRVTASLMFGVTGLFFFNIVFGPIALALGAVAARRHRAGSRDHVAALAGVALGVADLAVLAVVLLSQLHTGVVRWTI
jgi:hypothetical protein